jgi:hypothetical protein
MIAALHWFGVGVAAGVGLDRLALELRKLPATRFDGLRRRVNEDVNPWLLEHHLAGGPKAEIGTLEHVGRNSGAVHLTPVHPTLREAVVLIPAPMGVGSQWVQNVIRASGARLQLHETIHELDRPELIGVRATGFFPAPIAAPLDRIGWRYLRLHVVASAPGALAAR